MTPGRPHHNRSLCLPLRPSDFSRTRLGHTPPSVCLVYLAHHQPLPLRPHIDRFRGGNQEDDMPERSPSPNLPIIRPIRSSDAPGLQAFHRRLSEETVRGRYFSPHPVLSDEEARYFTELDPNTRAAMIATV